VAAAALSTLAGGGVGATTAAAMRAAAAAKETGDRHFRRKCALPSAPPLLLLAAVRVEHVLCPGGLREKERSERDREKRERQRERERGRKALRALRQEGNVIALFPMPQKPCLHAPPVSFGTRMVYSCYATHHRQTATGDAPTHALPTRATQEVRSCMGGVRGGHGRGARVCAAAVQRSGGAGACATCKPCAITLLRRRLSTRAAAPARSSGRCWDVSI
jgi:hypothetical protein